MVHPPEGGGEVFLDWEQAFDDEGYLRHCPVCGCRDLYAARAVPRVTAFVLVVAAALVAAILFGTGNWLAAMAVLILVAGMDLAILLFGKRYLTCYRCGSEVREVSVRRRHPGWTPAVAEKYRSTESDPSTSQ